LALWYFEQNGSLDNKEVSKEKNFVHVGNPRHIRSNEMKTDGRTIKAKVYVFAQMKTNYELDNLKDGDLPFNLRVKDFDYGDEASVRIMEHEISVRIPEGIDLTTKCIENLREKISAVEEQCRKDVADLQQRIRNLALIEYKPPSGEADIEWLPVEDLDNNELKPGGSV
jgi:hypothetical protein